MELETRIHLVKFVGRLCDLGLFRWRNSMPFGLLWYDMCSPLAERTAAIAAIDRLTDENCDRPVPANCGAML